MPTKLKNKTNLIVKETGKPVFKLNGEHVSEKSATIKIDDFYVNLPSIHGNMRYSEDELYDMLMNNEIKATSVHKKHSDAIKAAKERSKNLTIIKGSGFYKGGLAKYMETEKQTEEAFNLSDFFKETFKLQEPPAIKFGRELKEEFKNLTGTNTENKGMSYLDLIFDSLPLSNIGDPDEEYETSMETLYKAFNDNPKDFLKQLITGIGDNLGINRPYGVPSPLATTTPLKEDALLENPYGYGKEIVTDVATNVYDLFTKTEDMRAQQIYDKPFKNLTGEEQNKIRESILGNIVTTAEVATLGGFTYGAARRAIRENIANQNIDHSSNAYTSSPKTTKTIFTFDKNEIVEKEVDTDYTYPFLIETPNNVFERDFRINREVEKTFTKGINVFSPTIEALNNFPNYNSLKNKQLISPRSLWTHLTNSKINNKVILKSAFKIYGGGPEYVFAHKALDYYLDQKIINPKLINNIDYGNTSIQQISKVYEIIDSSLYEFNQAIKKAKAFPFVDDPNDIKYEVDLGHTKKYFSSAEDINSYVEQINGDFFNTINKALTRTTPENRSIYFEIDSYRNKSASGLGGQEGESPVKNLSLFENFSLGNLVTPDYNDPDFSNKLQKSIEAQRKRSLRIPFSTAFDMDEVPFTQDQRQPEIGLVMSGVSNADGSFKIETINNEYNKNYRDLQGVIVLRNPADIRSLNVQAVNDIVQQYGNVEDIASRYINNIRMPDINKKDQTGFVSDMVVTSNFDTKVEDAFFNIEDKIKKINKKNSKLFDPNYQLAYDQNILRLLFNNLRKIHEPSNMRNVTKSFTSADAALNTIKNYFSGNYGAFDMESDFFKQTQKDYAIDLSKIRDKEEEKLVLDYFQTVKNEVENFSDEANGVMALKTLRGVDDDPISYMHGFGPESLGHIRFSLVPNKDLLVIEEMQFDIPEALYNAADSAGVGFLPDFGEAQSFSTLPKNLKNYLKFELTRKSFPELENYATILQNRGSETTTRPYVKQTDIQKLKENMSDSSQDFNIIEKDGDLFIRIEQLKDLNNEGIVYNPIAFKENTRVELKGIMDEVDSDLTEDFISSNKISNFLGGSDYKIQIGEVKEIKSDKNKVVFETKLNFKKRLSRKKAEQMGKKFVEAEKQSGRLPIADIPDAMEKLLSSLVVEAQQRGATKIVLPPLEKILEARFMSVEGASPKFKKTYVTYFDQAVTNLIKKSNGKIKPVFIDLTYYPDLKNQKTDNSVLKDLYVGTFETVKGKGLDISDIVKDVEKVKGTKTLTVGLAKGGLI